MKKDLESQLNSPEKPSKKFVFKKYLADTLAMVSWSFVVEGSRELLIGMTPEQTLYSRLSGIPIDIFLGGPYGKFLDFVRSKFKVNEKSSFIKKAAVDIGALVTTMTPIYAGILYVIGVDPKTIAVSCASGLVLQTLYGRPYGMYVDFLRNRFGVKEQIKPADKK